MKKSVFMRIMNINNYYIIQCLKIQVLNCNILRITIFYHPVFYDRSSYFERRNT